MSRSSLLRDSLAVSTSLNSVLVTPRTPRTPYGFSRVDLDSPDREDADTPRVSLLSEEQRKEAASDLDSPTAIIKAGGDKKSPRLSSKDRVGIALLLLLYLIQGIPIGLALGSIPFLLRERLSYSQLGTFALSSYPYSLKLLWSPIVDAVFLPSVGRRKSWILPMQFMMGSIMMYISLIVENCLNEPGEHIYHITFVFTCLVLVSATQDVAVDGWTLTLLSSENLSYASTCQTIGLNTGYFASFTLFLALNSESFTTKWGIPYLSLGTYLRFWAVVCYLVTFGLAFFKKEDKGADEDDMSIIETYKTIWEICKLSHARELILVHLLAKIGFATNEAVTQLKFLEKGLSREDLALAVLIDFPIQMAAGWFTASRWSRGDTPLRPWIWAFIPRLFFAILAPVIVYLFPSPPIKGPFFAFLVVQIVLSSFTMTVQFVGMSAFHTRISDPLIGGTYMTLLNTFTNMGGTLPKWFVLQGVDLFSVATCQVPDNKLPGFEPFECVSDRGQAQCRDLDGGTCVVERDGYYTVSAICVAVGCIILVAFILPTARRLQALAVSRWRIKLS